MTDQASLPGRLIRVKRPASTPDELYAVALDDDDLALSFFKASYLGRPENVELIGNLSASIIIGLGLKPSAIKRLWQRARAFPLGLETAMSTQTIEPAGKGILGARILAP